MGFWLGSSLRAVILSAIRSCFGLAGAAGAYGLQCLAWSLMTHHVHPLVKSAGLRKLAGSWRRVLREGEKQARRKRPEAQLESGLPVGTERWRRGLEKKCRRRLHPGRPGRPRKEAAGAPNNR